MKRQRDHHIYLRHGKFVVGWSHRGVKHAVLAGDDIGEARKLRDKLLEGVELRRGPVGRNRIHAKAQPVAIPQKPQEKPRTRNRRPYYGAGCVILSAAVYATREAYDWAMASLPAARAIDAKMGGAK